MSPWTLLGWIVLVIVVLFIGLRLTIIVLEFAEQEGPKIKAHRKHKRALKGKVTCEFIGWEDEDLPGQEDLPRYQRKTDRVKVICTRAATHSTARTFRRYYCEEHAKDRRTHATNSYPQPLHRVERPTKTKVIT